MRISISRHSNFPFLIEIHIVSTFYLFISSYLFVYDENLIDSRQLRLRKWEKTRRDIGWRMNWINMQLYEFDYQIAQIDEHRKANKRKKALSDSVSLSGTIFLTK